MERTVPPAKIRFWMGLSLNANEKPAGPELRLINQKERHFNAPVGMGPSSRIDRL